ncbi:MAG: hypothetical protein HXY34_11500 [Candidatus Thorarchaeota archaeon]|nr:hypothetical protein [Candidatus Thorarchaeota archaeon]
MPDDQVHIDGLEEKVEKIAGELRSVRDEMKKLSSIAEMADRFKAMEQDLREVLGHMNPMAQIVTKIEAGVEEIRQDEGISAISEKLDKLTNVFEKLDSRIDKASARQEVGELGKKLDEVVGSVTRIDSAVRQLSEASENDALSKKIDDLQQYVAGLSGIEERFHDLTTTFEETKEIVGIIVRQLDDLERKHNKTLEEVSQALGSVTKMIDSSQVSASTERDAGKKAPARTESTEVPEEPRVFQGPLPSTIDGLMDKLLKMVSPQTEAVKMARALEEIRDQLTSQLQRPTPVLHDFGRIARELKSYPPTATLNDNDIARLNKEIRSWTSKLKEAARS